MLTLDDRKFLKSLRIQADDDIIDARKFPHGICPTCGLALGPFSGVCANFCHLKRTRKKK